VSAVDKQTLREFDDAPTPAEPLSPAAIRVLREREQLSPPGLRAVPQREQAFRVGLGARGETSRWAGPAPSDRHREEEDSSDRLSGRNPLSDADAEGVRSNKRAFDWTALAPHPSAADDALARLNAGSRLSPLDSLHAGNHSPLATAPRAHQISHSVAIYGGDERSCREWTPAGVEHSRQELGRGRGSVVTPIAWDCASALGREPWNIR